MTEAAARYRTRLAGVIVAALRDDVAIRAIGEGGAAARGRADEYSDLDLMIVAPLPDAGAIFARVEAATRTVAPITHTWSVEPAGFPETAQRFYFLAGAPRFFAIDCLVISESGIGAFLDRERHGEVVTWFDPDGLLRARPLDSDALARRRGHRLKQLQESVPVYAMLVDKELARGHALEAFGFYQALLRMLIELLGMRHRPHRFDFAWRYVERELPVAAQALIARYAFVPDADALATLAASLVDEIAAQLEALATEDSVAG